MTHSQFSAAAPPKQQYGVGPRLYVATPHTLAMDQVRNYFSHWGRVLDVFPPAGSRSRRGSYCFVTFETNTVLTTHGLKLKDA